LDVDVRLRSRSDHSTDFFSFPVRELSASSRHALTGRDTPTHATFLHKPVDASSAPKEQEEILGVATKNLFGEWL